MEIVLERSHFFGSKPFFEKGMQESGSLAPCDRTQRSSCRNEPKFEAIMKLFCSAQVGFVPRLKAQTKDVLNVISDLVLVNNGDKGRSAGMPTKGFGAWD